MQIRETFATAIQKRIEPVVKVVDRRPSVLFGFRHHRNRKWRYHSFHKVQRQRGALECEMRVFRHSVDRHSSS